MERWIEEAALEADPVHWERVARIIQRGVAGRIAELEADRRKAPPELMDEIDALRERLRLAEADVAMLRKGGEGL